MCRKAIKVENIFKISLAHILIYHIVSTGHAEQTVARLSTQISNKHGHCRHIFT